MKMRGPVLPWEFEVLHVSRAHWESIIHPVPRRRCIMALVCCLIILSIGSLLKDDDDSDFNPTFAPEINHVETSDSDSSSRGKSAFVRQSSSFFLPYERIRYPSKDGTMLHFFMIRQPIVEATAVTIVFFHGNVGNMGHRLKNAVKLFQNLAVNILMVDFRGYGLSEGTPSKSGIRMDARSAIDYLYTRNDINLDRIVLFGRSLGGAVAIDLVSKKDYAKKIWCLIVENTFTKFPKSPHTLTGCDVLQFVPKAFRKNKFTPFKKVGRVAVPTLFICGMSDEMVPPAMTESLYFFCGAAHKQMLKIPFAGHNDAWTREEYCDNITSFLNNLV